ncbi:MAG: carbohydrate kinase family protein [Burkholderiaceae bacterium]|nr:carbohydrate kinase family protein [Burkholderiaceae bacterium]
MTTLICGSIAYDSIMVFKGRFADHILPHQVHILNVAFLVPELRREFGGCAGNIAYNTKLLQGDAAPMATVGRDCQPYLDRLDHLGIDRRFVREIETSFTAQAFITTDADNNQITAFHPGAMSDSHLNQIPDDSTVSLGIVAPDGRAGMLQHAEEFAARGIPFMFDPGQGLPMFSGEELIGFIDRASYLAVNDYEAKLLTDRTQLTIDQLAKKVRALVVTHGGSGSRIYVDGNTLQIPIAPVGKPVDPTGCGDAYRAGLLVGIAEKMDWETIGRLAATMGSIKIEHSGGQNHMADRESIGERFHQAFGYRPW